MNNFTEIATRFTILAGLGGLAGCSSVPYTYDGFIPPRPLSSATNATDTAVVTVKPPLVNVPDGVVVDTRNIYIEAIQASIAPQNAPESGLKAAFGMSHDESFVSQPIGHYDLCRADQRACGSYDQPFAVIPWTPQNEQSITMTNIVVNDAIKPMVDSENPMNNGADERWVVLDLNAGVDLFGDCEDYALTKKKQLVSEGYPASAMFIVVLKKADGEGHAVLGLNTDQGIKLLDNLNDDVKSPEQTNYTFSKRQSSVIAGKWVDWNAPVASLKVTNLTQ